jgi:hypothetical protein
MFKKNNSADVATLTGFKTNNFRASKPENLFYATAKQKTTQDAKRRSSIFRCLIALARSEKFEKTDSGLVEITYKLPDLSKSVNFGLLDDDEIYRLGVCPVPSEIENIIFSNKLQKKFGDLSVCGCFYKTEDSWKLDVSPYLARSGLLFSVRNKRTGLIEYLRVYRYPDDQKSFLLQLREGISFG